MSNYLGDDVIFEYRSTLAVGYHMHHLYMPVHGWLVYYRVKREMFVAQERSFQENRSGGTARYVLRRNMFVPLFRTVLYRHLSTQFFNWFKGSEHFHLRNNMYSIVAIFIPIK